MAKFFKTFAKGILYILALPLLLVFLAVYFVISLISFIFLSIQGIILFFKGESLVGEMEEDRLAKERLDALMGANEQVKVQVPTPQPVIQEQVPVPAPMPTVSAPMSTPMPTYEPPLPEPEPEITVQMNNIDESNIESEDDIFSPLPEPEPEPAHTTPSMPYTNAKQEEINVSNDPINDHEYIIEDEYTPKDTSGGVDFTDYEGRE